MKYFYCILLLCIAQQQSSYTMECGQGCIPLISSLHMTAQSATNNVFGFLSRTSTKWTQHHLQELFHEGRLPSETFPGDITRLIYNYVRYLPVVCQLNANLQDALLEAVLSENEEYNNTCVLTELMKRGADINSPVSFPSLEKVLTKKSAEFVSNDQQREVIEETPDLTVAGVPTLAYAIAWLSDLFSPTFRQYVEKTEKKTASASTFARLSFMRRVYSSYAVRVLW